MNPAIELTGARLSFGDRTLWRDLDLAVAAGEFVAVLGPNGSGKTTLLKAVLGTQPLSGGSLQVLGRAPTRGDRRIGYIPQQRLLDASTPVRGADLVGFGVDGSRLGLLTMIVSRSVGLPHGIVAGQAWECESDIDVAHYHRAKTGALFAAATMAGAAAAGADINPWRPVGELIGEAYQTADDIRDAIADADEMGKPAGQDALLGRPNIVAEYGVAGAVKHLEALVGSAIEAIPDCPGADELRSLILSEAERLRPKKLAQHAA